jgi:hypothetical protein
VANQRVHHHAQTLTAMEPTRSRGASRGAAEWVAKHPEAQPIAPRIISSFGYGFRHTGRRLSDVV